MPRKRKLSYGRQDTDVITQSLLHSMFNFLPGTQHSAAGTTIPSSLALPCRSGDPDRWIQILDEEESR